MQDLQNLCTQKRINSSMLCEWAASLYYLMVTTFGGGSFTGKPLAEWLRDDAPMDQEGLKNFTATLTGFAAVLGRDAAKHDLVVALGESGQISAHVEESMRYYAASEPVLTAAEANRQARSGVALLYGPRIDISGISQATEFSVRARLPDGALSTITTPMSLPSR